MIAIISTTIRTSKKNREILRFGKFRRFVDSLFIERR